MGKYQKLIVQINRIQGKVTFLEIQNWIKTLPADQDGLLKYLRLFKIRQGQ